MSGDAALSLFGGPRLVGGPARQVVPFPSKAFALLAYLILSAEDNIAARGTIAHFLWEDSDQGKASNNLRQLLTRLRERQAVLGIKLLSIEGAHVRLERRKIDVDLCRFLSLVGGGEPPNIAELCRLYKGDLLDDACDNAPELESWIRVQRAHLRSRFIETVLGRIERAPLPEGAAEAESAARKVVHFDPYNERAWRALIRAGAAAGGPAGARAAFEECRQRLQSDLGVAPGAETVHLLASLDPEAVAPDRRPARASLSAPQRAREEPKRNQMLGDAVGLPRICLIMPPGESGDPLHQLAAALVEDVTVGLFRLKSLSVIAPHTAWQLGENGVEDGLARLGIQYIAATRLASLPRPPRLSVKLIASATREILWAGQFPLDVGSPGEVYRDLSTRIAGCLASGIERHELAQSRADPNPTAYRWYLAGLHHLRNLDLPAVRRARRSFRAAAVVAPDFAPALAGIARTLLEEWLLLARGDPELLDEAEKLARTAIEADPDDMRGYREVGVVSLFQHRLGDSWAYLARAEELSPQHADLLADCSDTLVHCGKAELARKRIEQAIALNPLPPDHYFWIAGGAFFSLQLYEDAVKQMMRMQDQTPAYRLLSACWAMLGETSRSSLFRHKALSTYPEFCIEKWLSIIPLEAKDDKAHYAGALRKAGFI